MLKKLLATLLKINQEQIQRFRQKLDLPLPRYSIRTDFNNKIAGFRNPDQRVDRSIVLVNSNYYYSANKTRNYEIKSLYCKYGKIDIRHSRRARYANSHSAPKARPSNKEVAELLGLSAQTTTAGAMASERWKRDAAVPKRRKHGEKRHPRLSRKSRSRRRSSIITRIS